MGCIRIPSLGDKADDGGDDSVGGAGSGRFFLSLLVAATVSGTGGKGRDDTNRERRGVKRSGHPLTTKHTFVSTLVAGTSKTEWSEN